MDVVRNKIKQNFNRLIFYNIMGVVLPFIISVIIVSIFSEVTLIWQFIDQGNFLLFSASFYTTSIYLFRENQNSIQDEKDFWLDLLAIWILVILASIYGVLYFMQINNTDLSDTKIVILRVLSLIIFFKSIYSLYRGFRLDNLNRVPKIDVEKHSKGEIDNIVNNL